MNGSSFKIENIGLDISKSLETLCKINGKCAGDLQGFLAKEVHTISFYRENMQFNRNKPLLLHQFFHLT